MPLLLHAFFLVRIECFLPPMLDNCFRRAKDSANATALSLPSPPLPNTGQPLRSLPVVGGQEARGGRGKLDHGVQESLTVRAPVEVPSRCRRQASRLLVNQQPGLHERSRSESRDHAPFHSIVVRRGTKRGVFFMILQDFFSVSKLADLTNSTLKIHHAFAIHSLEP